MSGKRHVRGLRALVVAAGFAMVGSACGSWSGGAVYVARWQPVWRGQHKEATFKVGLPGKGWSAFTRDRDQQLQVAWHNRAYNALIQVHSECEQHGDASLEALTDHLRIDFGDWEIVQEPTGETDAEGQPKMRRQQRYVTLVDREALRTTVRARLDGQPIMLEVVVLKKNGCVFDLHYMAREDHFDAGLPAFEKVLEGFAFPIKR